MSEQVRLDIVGIQLSQSVGLQQDHELRLAEHSVGDWVAQTESLPQGTFGRLV